MCKTVILSIRLMMKPVRLGVDEVRLVALRELQSATGEELSALDESTWW
jgi:hypothetical protein